MGLFSHNKENIAPVSPMASVLGEHLFYLDGRGANLFVHENCVVIDRTKGGLMNLGNRTYKIIPFRYIVSIQVKSTGATTGFIEFSTYAHEFTEMKGFDRVNDENTVNFGSEKSVEACRKIVEYIVPKIL